MSKKSGSVLGGSLLIMASCIGAGMLGLPIQTGTSGFLLSILPFAIVWLFMLLSGFFLTEATSWYKEKTNLSSMTRHLLGKTGYFVCWTFYLFLFYSLLVAYTAASGNMLSSFFQNFLKISFLPSLGSTFFIILFGALILKGTSTVDVANRYLMFFKIALFILIISACSRFINLEYLAHKNPKYLLASFPILITAFGYQNLIPTLTSYLNQDIQKVKKCIFYGSFASLIIYLIWQAIVLGIIPLEGPLGILSSITNGKESSQMLSENLQTAWLSSLVQMLGFIAVLTSFLTVALGLAHFLSDGLKINYSRKENILISVLTLLPPLVIALFYSNLFFTALNFAGGICGVVLFGLLPIFMVYKGRYIRKMDSKSKVFGGKLTLLITLIFMGFIFSYELYTLVLSTLK